MQPGPESHLCMPALLLQLRARPAWSFPGKSPLLSFALFSDFSRACQFACIQALGAELSLKHESHVLPCPRGILIICEKCMHSLPLLPLPHLPDLYLQKNDGHSLRPSSHVIYFLKPFLTHSGKISYSFLSPPQILCMFCHYGHFHIVLYLLDI